MEESRELYRKKEDSVYLTEGENTVHLGDNEIFMKSLINGDMKEKLQMIYIDPPFFSKSDYVARITDGDENVKKHAYGDRWEQGLPEVWVSICSV